MSELIDTLRAIVREELSRTRSAELGIVVSVYANDGDANNHQVDVRLRASGVELKRAPVTVQRYGLSSLPMVGDLVLVMFLGGDLNAPMVIGCVYDENVQAPEANASEVVYQVPDEAGERHFHMELPSGTSITFDDEKIRLVSDGSEIEIEKDGTVKIVSAKDIELSAKGNISMQADQNIAIEAGQSLELKGSISVDLEAGADANVKAAILKFGGLAQFSAS